MDLLVVSIPVLDLQYPPSSPAIIKHVLLLLVLVRLLLILMYYLGNNFQQLKNFKKPSLILK